MHTHIHRRRAAVAFLVTAAIVVLPAAPALATDPPPVSWTGATSATIEYAEYWQFDVSFPGTGTSEYTFNNTGAPAGYTPAVYVGPDPSNSMQLVGDVTVSPDAAPLGAGSYSFILHVKQTYGSFVTYEGETATPAHLTITPAKLGLTVRAVPDPANPNVAIVSAAFTGRFVDEYGSSFFPTSAVSPAGKWTFTIVDSDGAVALKRDVERQAGSDVLAASFAWADAEPDTTYAISAEFTPEGTSGANFAITPASPFGYTAPDNARPVPTSTATSKPDASLPESTGFGVPLWGIILVIALILGLASLVTVLSVRTSRSKLSTAEGAR